jgi:hypothetical protein
MHITEISSEHIEELKKHVEINEQGHIITKKLHDKKGPYGSSVGSKAKVGSRRGSKTKYGQNFTYNFLGEFGKLVCRARDIVWILANGPLDPNMTVYPIDGDVFNDRIENLALKKRNNGRRPGSKDVNKRTVNRLGLTRKEVATALQMKKSGATWREISETMGYSVDCIKKWVKKDEKYKPALNWSHLTNTKEYDIENIEDESGIYCIAMCPNETGCSKFYIGSTVSTRTRIEQHIRELKTNCHYNSDFQELYNSGMKIRAFLLEACSESELLEKEERIRSQYCEGSLINKNRAVLLDEIRPWLEKARHRFTKNKYTIDKETDCWEWNVLDASKGYGNQISVSIKLVQKSILPHRLSYYIHKGEYPPLLRHKCDNKSCVNPDHLESGSHRQNGLDKSRDFRKDFEYWWLEYSRDIKKLTEHFGWSSTGAALEWERKLGLREKYPEIYWENSKYMSPEEKQKQSALAKEKKRKRKQQQERQKQRMERLDAIKHDIINIKKRYSGASQEAIAAYFNIKKSDVAKITKGMTSSFEDLWNRKEMVDVLEYFNSIDAFIRSASKAQLEGAINRFPHLEKQIKNYVPDVFYRRDHEQFTTFFSEFIENKKKQKASI